VISAAVITGIRSDLPGQITAQVTENIYDSPTGRILLVPQGTRVVGQYDNNVQFGQSRVLLVWNRLIFPNGRSIVLERQPGADAEGLRRPAGRRRLPLVGSRQRRPGSRLCSASARSWRPTMMTA
jgi:type IV secretory pathway VirB10-like protein